MSTEAGSTKRGNLLLVKLRLLFTRDDELFPVRGAPKRVPVEVLRWKMISRFSNLMYIELWTSSGIGKPGVGKSQNRRREKVYYMRYINAGREPGLEKLTVRDSRAPEGTGAENEEETTLATWDCHGITTRAAYTESGR